MMTVIIIVTAPTAKFVFLPECISSHLVFLSRLVFRLP